MFPFAEGVLMASGADVERGLSSSTKFSAEKMSSLGRNPNT